MSEQLRCQALVKWIRARGLAEAPPQLVAALQQLSPHGYQQVARALLAGTTDAERDAGVVLLVVRPQPPLYWDLLWGGISLDDPSLKRDAALALLHLVSIPHAVADLLVMAQHERWNPEHSLKIERVIYWFRYPVLWDQPECYDGSFLKVRDGTRRWVAGYEALSGLWQPRVLPRPTPKHLQAVAHDWAVYYARMWG